MQFEVGFIAAALLAPALLTMSASITGFVGAGCTGAQTNTVNVGAGTCVTLGSGSVRSIGFSAIPNQIQFYVSGGAHDNCANGDSLTIAACSGCADAPNGFNWESVAVF